MDIPTELMLCDIDFDWSGDKVPLLLKTTNVHGVIDRLVANCVEQAKRIAELEGELAAAKRGEFICDRCHLRKDGPMEDAGF